MTDLHEEVWRNWERNGKQDFMKSIRSLLPAEEGNTGGLDNPDVDSALKRRIYDLIWKALKNVLNRDACVKTLGEISIMHSEMGCLIVDILSLIDTETMLIGGKEERERFINILKDSERFLSEGILKERMEIDTLGEAGIVKLAKKFFTTVIKMKTKMFYKQQKYNLFREECEGYAKLVTELNQDLSTTSPAEILEVIKSIIGYFNLDPNRVLDIILESFECQLDQHDFFIDLLREYTPDKQTLNELLGFKFKFYTTEVNKASNGTTVPESLYLQTGLMIQHGILDLEAIYEMLGPDDSLMQENAEKEIVDAREFIRKMNIVSTKDKEESDDKPQDDQLEEEVKFTTNQKFGLLAALLQVGAWKHAEKIIGELPTHYAVAQPIIATALGKLIHTTMQPIHKRYSGLTSRIRTKTYEPLNNKGAPSPVKTFEEFRNTVVPMLLALGPYSADDPVLLYKTLRILKSSLGIPNDENGKDKEKHSVDPNTTCLYFDILTIMDDVFLPALSLSEGNCCLAEEIWSILRVYPYHCRYRLYGLWKSDTYSQYPLLMRKKADIQKKSKNIMQRISKENVKPTSRKIGKVTNSSPVLLFDYVLAQVQLYDNLIGPVVDSLKYLTSLSFDVLSYSIIEALSNPEKDRTKHDTTSISLWLQSLSNFCGAVYKKYNIELTGVLQYVANQLKNKKSLDLLILKEIVLKMSGIEASEEMTNEQIDAMAGGDLLRQEAGSFNQIKNTKKSSQRLKDALIDNNLAVPLMLLMAQQRNCVVYEETADSHLKLVGKLFDQCQDTLVQFGSFLACNLSVDDYTRRLPPMNELLTRYHVNSDLAFFLARPMFNHQISLKYDEMRKADKSWKTRSETEKQDKYVDTALMVMEPVTAAIRPLHPSKVWDDISPQFLATFWSLTMYDLFVPEEVYSKEMAKKKVEIAKVEDNRELNNTRKKKEKERINTIIDKMTDEEKKQKGHVEKVMARLKREKDSWFFSRSAKLAKNETITTFLQLCLFPRCIFTANEAIYCAKFVQVIHSLKTPNFSTLICFDRIFCDITYTVTSCTENEAQRYGRFLAAMLEIVNRWHSTKEIFEEECVGYPGFVTKFRVADKNGANEKPDDHVDYENYRHVCHKWHYKIAKALVVCLESKDFVQIRNALTVLTKILPHFPLIVNLSVVIEKRIDKVCADEKEQRKDLYIKATSYSGQLKLRKSKMLKENEFHVTKKAPPTSETKTPATSKEVKVEKSGTNSEKNKSHAAAGRTKISIAENSSASRDSTSRGRESASRERDAGRRSESRETDRKSRERDRISRERSKNTPDKAKDKKRTDEKNERSSMDRHSRDRDATSESKESREQMPPPNSRRTSTEPSDDKDSKRRKLDHQDDNTATDGRRDKDRIERKRAASLELSKESGNLKKSDRKKDIEVSSTQNGSSLSSGSKRSRKHTEVPDRQLEQDFDDLPDHSKTKHKTSAANGDGIETNSNSSKSKSKSGSSSSKRSESKGRK